MKKNCSMLEVGERSIGSVDVDELCNILQMTSMFHTLACSGWGRKLNTRFVSFIVIFFLMQVFRFKTFSQLLLGARSPSVHL